MSRNDEQFDQLLRTTLGDKTFEQKPQYWESAKQLIDNHRKQRNRNTIFYSISAVLVAVVASAWILVSTPNQTSPTSENDLAFASVNPAITNTTEQGNPAPQLSPQKESANQPSGLSTTQTPPSTSVAQTSTQATNQASTTGARKQQPASREWNEASNAQSSQVESAAISKQTQEPERINFRQLVLAPKFRNSLASDTFNRKEFEKTYAQQSQQQLWLLEAGVNSYNGLSANVHGGIRYMRFVSSRFAFSIGASYAQLHQDMNRTYQNIDYTFGQQVQETKINTKRIDYIELPVAVHYAINTKHLINIGCIPAYAIHTNDEVTYSLGETPSSGKITYLDAINRFDMQLQAGYSYRFNQTWMLSANYQFGLMDISNNNVFKSTNFDRNQGLRLTLGYKLF